MRNPIILLLIAWSTIFIVLNIKWLTTDNTLPSWDEANYLEASEVIYQSFRTGPQEFFNSIGTVLPRRPPLIAYLPLPLYIIIGNSAEIALSVNFLFLILFITSYFLLVKAYFDSKIALIATIFTSTMPLFYGLLRRFYAEFGLMALTVIWMYCLHKSNHLLKKRVLILLGIITGLGILIKITFPLYIIGFLSLSIIAFLKKHGFKKLITNLLFIGIPCLLVILPWYSRNLATALWHAKRSADPVVLQSYYYGSPFNPEVIFLTLMDWSNYALSGYYSIVLILGLSLALLNRRLKVSKKFLIVISLPLVLSFFSPNKDYRLALPLLPLFGFMIAYIYIRIFQTSLIFVLLLCIFPVIIFVNNAIVYKPVARITLGPILILDNNIGNYVKTPNTLSLNIEDALKTITYLFPKDSTKNISILIEDEAININTIQYLIAKNRFPLKVISLSYSGITHEEYSKRLKTVDYFIVRSHLAQKPTYIDINSLERVENNILFRDGTNLLIYRSPK